MSNFIDPWTPEQDEVLRDNRGLSDRELVPLVSQAGPARTAKAISRRRDRLFADQKKSTSNAWTDPEKAILTDLSPTTSDQGIVEALKSAGFTRSLEGVKRARERYELPRFQTAVNRPGIEELKPIGGTFADRDREFVRLVQAEALRLGIARKDAA